MIHTEHTYNQEEIDRYLLGRMTPDEEAGFRERLERDSRLNDEVGLMRRMLRAISLRASRFDAMRRWDGKRGESHADTTPAAVASDRLWPQWIMVAASVIILVAVGLTQLYTSRSMLPTASVNSVKEQLSAERKHRGASIEMAGIERQLKDLRRAADYTLSDINSAMLADAPGEVLRPEEAEYQRIIAEYDRYELTWLRIQTLISAGRIAEAKEELVKYAAEEGYNQKEAQSLLNQFE